MNLRESIRRIIKEQLSPSVKRRMQDFDLDELVRWAKQLSFNPKNTVDTNVKSTIRKVAVEAFPDEKHFSSEDEHENQWAHFIVALEHKYYNELTEYFTNKKEEYENRAPEPFIYSLVKHEENGRGFSETFTDMDKLISKFGDWLPKLDWSEVKDNVDKIEYFPNNNFTGTYSSNRMLISKAGDDGNQWGYSFSIVKSVPEEYLDMNTKKLKKNLQESIRRILKEDTEPILNDLGEKYYISWDENYGKSFKLVHTPEGAQSGVEWNPDLISVVTPENGLAWTEWKELPKEKLHKWKKNWDDVQNNLSSYKYNQIVRNM